MSSPHSWIPITLIVLGTQYYALYDGWMDGWVDRWTDRRKAKKVGQKRGRKGKHSQEP